jgi:predicted RNA-binding Zn-ribbon protein involved in translation (DUF1610 family)
MEVKGEFLAPCGLYCGVCAVLYATRDDNLKLKEALVGVYKGKLPGSDDLTAEDIHCKGCLSDEPFFFCRECEIKDCVRSKGYTGCHECDEFPCQLINDFPIAVGKQVILRAIPQWREVGTEKWVEQEEARYLCPNCGNQLFRGARRCNKCKIQLDLD